MAKAFKLRVWAAPAAFWLWAPTLLVIVAMLMVGHWYSLPKPTREDRALEQAVHALRAPGARGDWTVVHALYSKCRCSQRILTHLFNRRPLAGTTEVILLVGSHAEYERRARESGFRLDVISPEELLKKYHFEAAPLFAVSDSNGRLRYVGGYTDRKQGLAVRDVEIIHALQANGSPRELPLFGCAVSRSLQALMDPLGIKNRT
jgi:hypothetical protein